MEWLLALASGSVVLALFWLPGLAVLAVLRVRGLLLAGTAPLVTVALMGGGGIVADILGVRWGPAVAATLTGVAVVAAYLLTRHDDTPLPLAHAAPGPRPWLQVALATGVLAQVVPVLVGMGRPGRLLDAFDAVFHVNVLRYVQESGIASGLTIVGEDAPSTGSGFYAVGWHAVTALAPAWPEPAVVFNLAVFLPTAVAWTTGVALLARAAFPAQRRVVVWAALLSAAGVTLPQVLAQQKAGLVPNALAVALLPAALSVVIGHQGTSGPRWRVLALCCAGGLAMVHPNALVSAVVVLTVWFLTRRWRALRAAMTPGRLAAVAGSAVAVGVLLAWASTTRLGRSIVGFRGDEPSPALDTVTAVLSGQMGSSAGGGGLLVVAAAAAGAWWTWRAREARPVLAAGAAMLTLFVLGRSPVPVLTDLDAAWYHEPKRIAPAAIALMLPFAAVGLDRLGPWLTTPGPLRTALAGTTVSLVVGGLVVAQGLALGAVETAGQARASYAAGRGGEPTFATDAELAMIHRLADRLDPDTAVLGDPHSGSAHLYALIDQRVAVRTSTEHRTPELDYVRAHLGDLGASDALCDALDALDVGYLYVDPVRFRSEDFPYPDLTAPPPAGVRLIDSGGTARVYEITACG